MHLMPNLPGASPSLDAAMFRRMSHGEGHQADQWKIYPCEVTPWTVIKKVTAQKGRDAGQEAARRERGPRCWRQPRASAHP